MSFKIKYNLSKLKGSAKPDAVFKKQLHTDLMSAWNGSFGKTPWYHGVLAHRIAASALLIIILATSSGAYAYASPEVTEGSVLFPVKEAMERVEEVTKFTPESKAAFYLKQIERREKERLVLQTKKPAALKEKYETVQIATTTDADEKTASLPQPDTGTVGKKARATDGSDEGEQVKKINRSIDNTEKKLEKAKELMEKLAEKNTERQKEIRAKIEKRLEERKKRLEKLEEKQLEHAFED